MKPIGWTWHGWIFSLGWIVASQALHSAAADPPVVTSPAGDSQIDEELRNEILQMAEADQRFRMAEIKRGFNAPPRVDMFRNVDGPNTRRMKQIVAQYGWPGRSLVGNDGAGAAWLLVQHATSDAPFMEHCLSLMQAAPAGEVSASNIAYLEDRVRIRQGKPQRYGTQFKQGADGHLVPDAIEDEAHVDERRKAIGLPTMAESIEMIRRVYEKRDLSSK